MATITNIAEAEAFLNAAVVANSAISVKREADDLRPTSVSHIMKLDSFTLNTHTNYNYSGMVATEVTLHSVNGVETTVLLFIGEGEELLNCECDDHYSGCYGKKIVPNNTWEFNVIA